jgi:hypothetical protein
MESCAIIERYHAQNFLESPAKQGHSVLLSKPLLPSAVDNFENELANSNIIWVWGSDTDGVIEFEINAAETWLEDLDESIADDRTNLKTLSETF